MKKWLRIFCIFFYSINTKALHAQCLTNSVFLTDSIGTRSEKIAFSLCFKIEVDSIHVFHATNPTNDFLSFTIVNTMECNWNTDFSEGFGVFTVKVIGSSKSSSNAILKIMYQKKGGEIEIQYPNGEKRIFSILKRQSKGV